MNASKEIESNELYTQSTLLDPSFKKFSFQDDNKYKYAVDKLKHKLNLKKSLICLLKTFGKCGTKLSNNIKYHKATWQLVL